MTYAEMYRKIELQRKAGTLSYDWFQENFTLDERVNLANTDMAYTDVYLFLFSEEELLSISNRLESTGILNVFPILSDKNKLFFLQSYTQDSSVVNYFPSLIRLIDSDEYKLEACRLLEEVSDKADIVASLSSDDLKESLLSEYRGEERIRIITSLEDDKRKEKYIRIGSHMEEIIASFSSDELKASYLRKYQLILSQQKKARIISSFESADRKISYLKYVRESSARADIIATLEPDEALSYLPTISKDEDRLQVLYQLNNEYIAKAIPILGDKAALELVENFLLDYQKGAFLSRFSQKQIGSILESYQDTSLVLEQVLALKDFSKIEVFISHLENFPPYLESYEPLIASFAEHYQVSKERLTTLAELTSMQVLSFMKGKNIQTLLHLEEEDFNHILSFFAKNKTTLKESTLNDILNSLLQRQFKVQNPDTMDIFSHILHAIQLKDMDEAQALLLKINESCPFLPFLQEKGISKEEFLQGLFQENENMRGILREIAGQYLVKEKNQYIQDNLENMRQKCLEQCFEKTTFIKEAMQKISFEFLMDSLNSMSHAFFTKEDRELIDNPDLLKQVYQFKQNPRSYGKEIPLEVKRSLITYQHIFGVLFERGILNFVSPLKAQKEYHLPERNPAFLLSTLSELDISHLLEVAKKNPEMYQKLLEVLDKYQFLAWGESFSPFLQECDLYFDASTVANLLNNFSEFYPKLQGQKGSANAPDITITRLIDQANCYGSDSIRYSQIFGRQDYQLLSANPAPNSASMKRKERLEIALKKVKQLYKRDSIPVPAIQKEYTLPNGKKILVEVGNVSDMSNLTLGERTGACMRIGGAGESLYNFCLENPNGFHITFHNAETGELISRVSAFRNGNLCCLNQLRNSLSKEYSNKDLIFTCKEVANDFLSMTKSDPYPIDQVIISKDFAMQESNDKRLDLEVENIKAGLGNFYSDVSENAVSLASREEVKIQLGKNRVTRYAPPRSLPKTYQGEAAISALEHMEALRQHLNGVSLDEIEIPSFTNVDACIIGPDWYVASSSGEIKKVLFEGSSDKRARQEMEQAVSKLAEEFTYQGGYER